MSNQIPFEIQMEIIQRMQDVKSLIRYQSVSKAWKSVIDSKEFVTAHTLRHYPTHNRHHLLISTQDCSNCIDCDKDYTFGHCHGCNYAPVKYFSIVDDDTFPHQKVSVFVPDSIDKLDIDHLIPLGGSHGLVCFYDYVNKKDIAVIWNPSIGKTVSITIPNVFCGQGYWTVFGFGVCPWNLDPKLVKITYVTDFGKLQDVNASTQIEVFTLNSGETWRTPLSSNVPDKYIKFRYSQALVGRFLYWFAVDISRNHNLIMSFDLTSEEFTKVNPPDSLALEMPGTYFSLYNLKESLIVLEAGIFRKIYHVWMMIGHGCSRSFNKLYSINAPLDAALIHSTLGIRKTGAPIIEVDNDKEHSYKYERALAMYDPESQSSTNIGIYGLNDKFIVHSYIETLLLLGHRDIRHR